VLRQSDGVCWSCKPGNIAVLNSPTAAMCHGCCLVLQPFNHDI
jgi:hypothetical protein